MDNSRFTVERFDANEPEKGWVVFARPLTMTDAKNLYFREVEYERQGRVEHAGTEHAPLFRCTYRLRDHFGGESVTVLEA